MNRFPINYVLLEGPDLSGKTTLYSTLHKASSYDWNIQDRSCLSMLIHAEQYGRDVFLQEENLKRELLNLNNKLVILLPGMDIIRDRYEKRGDDIQSLESIEKLYFEFEKHAEKLKYLPNVFVIEDTGPNVSQQIANAFYASEISTLEEIAESVFQYAGASSDYEATPLIFTLYDDGSFFEVDPSVMSYEPEREYYERILTTMMQTIKDELSGHNPYNRVETVNSRRFIYTDDTCISLIQASYRENILDMHFVLRSSEVATTFRYDLKFLHYLTSLVYTALGLNRSKDIVRMRFNLNSAHILS